MINLHEHALQTKLNDDIEKFSVVHPITEDMYRTFEGISQMIMLDRYSHKDTALDTLKVGDLVLLTVQEDPTYPVKGLGVVEGIDALRVDLKIKVLEEYVDSIAEEHDNGIVYRTANQIEKPLELFFEQIAKRVSTGLADNESEEDKKYYYSKFYKELSTHNLVPAGRVLYGAGTDSEVTFFNCYVMPYIQDSRHGLAEHRREVMEIMSRGGGVGTNGSTLRPKDTLARGVNGKSSGSVSWLNDLSQLTHLVEQGGSRRGAQMILLADSHPDIIEFVISKMQNPDILRLIIQESKDPIIQEMAKEKLKFTPLTASERDMYQGIINASKSDVELFEENTVNDAKTKMNDGGHYSVHEPDALTGANISVSITSDFMDALKHDEDWYLRFPDVENYTEEEMNDYNNHWHEIGDVREWESLGYGIKTYHSIKAKELWNLINISARYSAEPGIFFIDRANDETNAKAYGQKVVGVNPCGEQPLAPYSVCNLSAINLAEMVNKETRTVDYDKLKNTIETAVRLQDNVIDATPYFLEENKKQALGERRIGLGVMGLADLLIYTGHRYGSEEGNKVINELFKFIAHTAYRYSVELAKDKGSFPFLVGETDEETKRLREEFISSGYMQKMDEDLRQDILKYGIRNSHLLTVAPTGSTGTMVGVGTGLEPYFAFKYYRSGRLGKFIEVNEEIVSEYLAENPSATADNLPDEFVTAMELSPSEHVGVQTAVQEWVDSSISKTVNAPAGFTVEQVSEVYINLHDNGAKGGTIYVDGSRDTQVLNLDNDDELNEQDDLTSEIKNNDSLKESKINNEQYGTEVGDICPFCRKGTVEIIGGCNTCSNCSIQLSCGT